MRTAHRKRPERCCPDQIARRAHKKSNHVPFPVSFGTFNAQQQSDIHAYWEFNPSTNWVFPHYELPFTGGVPTTFAAGMQYAVQSVIAGDGPGVGRPDNNKITYGDNPDSRVTRIVGWSVKSTIQTVR